MKKIIFAAAVALMASSASALSAAHTLTGTSTITSPCTFCHAVHVFTATDLGDASFLWNRNLVGVASGDVGTDRCYTCHAGTVAAPNNIGGGDATGMVSAAGDIRGLSATHPTGDYVALTTPHPGEYTAGWNLLAGAVTCSSCHDVHANVANLVQAGFACTQCHVK